MRTKNEIVDSMTKRSIIYFGSVDALIFTMVPSLAAKRYHFVYLMHFTLCTRCNRLSLRRTTKKPSTKNGNLNTKTMVFVWNYHFASGDDCARVTCALCSSLFLEFTECIASVGRESLILVVFFLNLLCIRALGGSETIPKKWNVD